MIYLPYIHITNIISTYINHKYLPCNFINFINIYHIFTIHTISNIYHHIFTIYTSQIIISTPSSHQPSPKRQRHRPPFAPFARFLTQHQHLSFLARCTWVTWRTAGIKPPTRTTYLVVHPT